MIVFFEDQSTWVPAVLDSGSEIEIIGENQLPPGAELRPLANPMQVCGATGQVSGAVGVTSLRLASNNFTVSTGLRNRTIEVFVMKGDVPLLLGRRVMADVGLMLDLKHEYVHRWRAKKEKWASYHVPHMTAEVRIYAESSKPRGSKGRKPLHKLPEIDPSDAMMTIRTAAARISAASAAGLPTEAHQGA